MNVTCSNPLCRKPFVIETKGRNTLFMQTFFCSKKCMTVYDRIPPALRS